MTPATNVNAAAGVYTYTTDLSQRIKAASTSIGCIVGAAPKGPVLTPTFVTTFTEYKNKFGVNNGKNGFSSQSAEPFLEESTQLYMIRVVNGARTAGAYLTVDDPNAPDPVLSLNNFDDGTNQPQGIIEPETNVGFNPSTPGVNNILGAFHAIDPGTWNNEYSIFVKPANPKGVSIRGAGHDVKHFWVEIYKNYTGSSFQSPEERHLVTRHFETDENGDQLYIEDVINNKSNIVRYIDNTYCSEVDMIDSASEQLDGGTNGIAPTDDQIAEAWELIDDPDELDVNILINNGYDSHIVHIAMDTVSKQRNDCISVLDAPKSCTTVADLVNYRRNTLNLNSSESALYASRAIATDTNTGKKVTIPMSALAASAMALTDRTRGLWFAPAGISRGKLRIEGTTEHFGPEEREILEQNQINCVRKIPSIGYCLWDQQTLQAEASAFQSIAVVRLVKFVLKSTSISAINSVFDPNDEFLWRKLVGMAEKFVKPIKQGRGLNDYSILCNSDTNKPETIANGDVIVYLILEPTIHAKRIHIMFNINKTGSTATDLSAAA